MTAKQYNSIRAIDRAFTIIDGLKELNGATITELADHVDLPKSTVYNYLQTLLADEYVVEDEGIYRVGLRFLEIGEHARCKQELYQVAPPEIDKLAQETGELANLVVEEHGLGVYLYRSKGDDAVDLDNPVGKRQYLNGTAFGKAMLAYMSEEDIERIIDRHGLPTRTKHTVTDRETLYEELDEIRDRGWALDDGEGLQGLRCVGVPILTDDETVHGAVSISGPKSRFRGERFREEIPDMLQSATNVIEINMNYL